MAAGAAVPWETCAEADCLGARRGADGRCLAHAEPLVLPPASSGPGVDLDGRGVRFTEGSFERVLERCPRDEAGRRLLGTVRFDRATFMGDVSLDEAVFSGDVSLPGATFVGAARFGGAAFAGATDFSEVTFETQAWFVGASFGGPASFRAARFLGPAWFQQATFASHAIFDGAAFTGDATLSGVAYGGVASFWGAAFDRHARFDRSTSAGGWRFEAARFEMEGEGPGMALLPPVDGPSHLVEGRSPAERPRPSYEAPRGFDWRVPAVLVAVLAVVTFIVLRPSGTSTSAFQENQEEGTSGFGFLHKDPDEDEPTRYDPCQPIRYVVNPALAPPSWMPALEEALGEVSRASGLRFESAGTTSERVTPDLPADMNRVYGWPRDVEGTARPTRTCSTGTPISPSATGRAAGPPSSSRGRRSVTSVRRLSAPSASVPVRSGTVGMAPSTCRGPWS